MELLDTGISWIGKIPSNWKILPLKSVSKVILGKMLQDKQKSQEETLERYICAKDVHLDGINWYEPKEMYFSPIEKNLLLVKNGDLLIVEGGAGAGGAFVVDNPTNYNYYVQNSINIVRVNKQFAVPQYVYYWIFKLVTNKYVEVACNVATIPHFTKEKVSSVQIPLPSIDIQQRIVNYLDKKTAEIDTQISLLSMKRDAYMRLKKSIIHCAVTHGLNPDVEMKDSGVDWIGLMSKHWEVKRIKELCPFISRGSTPDYVDEGNYLVMNQAVFSSGSINYEIVRFSSYMKDDSKIEKGDLLIASTGGGILGKLYFFDDEQTFYADTHVTIVRNKKKSFHVKFLYYLLSIEYNMINSCMAKGSTNQTELQRDKLIAFEIAVPPVDEQKRIIEYLDIKCANIEAAIKNIGKQIDALKRLKRALINEVVTGQRAV